MRKAVSFVVLAVLVSVFLDALLGPDETIAQRDMTTQNDTPFYGLHVALPPNMKNFPVSSTRLRPEDGDVRRYVHRWRPGWSSSGSCLT